MSELDELNARVDGLTRLVGELADTVAQANNGHSDLVTPALELVADAAPQPTTDAMTDLEAWVSWAVDAYGVERWPTCWKEHRGLVIELASHRQAWAQAAGGTSGQALVTWHESWWRFLARVHCDAVAVAACQGGRNHRNASARMPANPARGISQAAR